MDQAKDPKVVISQAPDTVCMWQFRVERIICQDYLEKEIRSPLLFGVPDNIWKWAEKGL